MLSRVRVAPPTLTVVVTRTVDVPTVDTELTITVHCPLALVVPLTHVPPVIVPTEPAAREAVTVAPLIGANVPLVLPSTVTVNVWGWLTSFSPFGVMLMRASQVDSVP